MQFSIRNIFKSLWEIEEHERTKTFFLGISFFLIIFSYTLTKELKDSVFMGIIGTKDWVPFAKFLTTVALVPLVFFYSKLVDTIRRYQLLCLCTAIYACIGLLCAYLVGHSSVGLPNELTGAYRVFGWVFYFFIESFSPFVLSVFWAFLNSVSSPKSAKSNYGLLISASKLGGMTSAGIGWFMLYNSYWFHSIGFSDIGIIQFLLVVSSAALLMVPLSIMWMMKHVPGQYLHGYEAAYKFEKKQSKSGSDGSNGMWSGLIFLLKNPYTFGIFASVLCYEMISSVLSFQRLGVAQEVGCGAIAGTSCFLLGLSFSVHCVGFFISAFGTRMLVSRLGERLSLLLMPISMGTLLFYYMYSTSPYAILVSFVVIRAIYYSFNQPVMEALYIPTVKAVKFKSKSWIDTFGKKMSKSLGSIFNGGAAYMGVAWSGILHTGFFGFIVLVWTIVAYFLGKRYHKAIKNQEVIGSEEYE